MYEPENAEALNFKRLIEEKIAIGEHFRLFWI